MRSLREAGVRIGTVLDVGVHEQTPELRAAFPDVRHILFEPADDFHPAIRLNYAEVDHVLVAAAVSDANGTTFLEKYSIDGGGVSHSAIVDPALGGEVTAVPVTRLDTFMSARQDDKPYLLKVDVDGAEVPILRGAEGIWQDIDVVIVEFTRDTLIERMSLVAAQGFVIYDIVDLCYYDGMFHQADLVMVAGHLLESGKVRALDNSTFSWTKWVPVASLEPAVQAAAR